LDIAPHAPHHWDIFLDLIDRPTVLMDPIYRDRHMRIQLFDLLTDIIAESLSDRSVMEFVEAGQAAGLPCATMQTASQFVEAMQPRARGYFIPADPAGASSFDLPGRPFMSSPNLINYERSAPRLGEANEDIYVHELGHSRDELAKWQADGLI
jgi:formyl-CoA transferase